MTLSRLILGDIEVQNQGYSDFEVLYLVKEQSWAICY